MKAAVVIGRIGEVKRNDVIELVENGAIGLQNAPAEQSSLGVAHAIAGVAGSQEHTLRADQEHGVDLADPPDVQTELLGVRLENQAVIPTGLQGTRSGCGCGGDETVSAPAINAESGVPGASPARRDTAGFAESGKAGCTGDGALLA